VPPRLGHRPLLLGQLRGGVGARARQDSLELSNSRLTSPSSSVRSTIDFAQLVLDPARSIEPDRHGDRSQRGADAAVVATALIARSRPGRSTTATQQARARIPIRRRRRSRRACLTAEGREQQGDRRQDDRDQTNDL